MPPPTSRSCATYVPLTSTWPSCPSFEEIWVASAEFGRIWAQCRPNLVQVRATFWPLLVDVGQIWATRRGGKAYRATYHRPRPVHRELLANFGFVTCGRKSLTCTPDDEVGWRNAQIGVLDNPKLMGTLLDAAACPERLDAILNSTTRAREVVQSAKSNSRRPWQSRTNPPHQCEVIDQEHSCERQSATSQRQVVTTSVDFHPL